MAKEAALTVRVPTDLKRRLAARARRERRSVSAQVVHELEQALANEQAERTGRSVLGMFEGVRVPTEKDFAYVRALLWGTVGKRHA
jgi:plasmid stability protein